MSNVCDKAANKAKLIEMVKLRTLIKSGNPVVVVINSHVRERSILKSGMKVEILDIDICDPIDFNDQKMAKLCFWMDVDSHIEHNTSISSSFGDVGEGNDRILPYYWSMVDGEAPFDFDIAPIT
ncbi:hypothetical protein LMH73_018610 [Vibrio splendidus]|nr:hypothetical protein [Vibrio splendidus]MCC4882749.1 hypothetical protein [Vibrio splendidus]